MHKWRKTLLPLLAGALLTPLPYVTALWDSSKALLYRDLSNVFLPLKHVWITAIKEIGRVPHWDPFHYGGVPYLADPSDGPLYPLNFFFLLFAEGVTPRTLLFFIVLHHIIIFCGGYFLFRHLRIRPALSLVGGISLSWSGYVITASNLLHIFCSLVAVPFLFLFFLRARKRGWRSVDTALAGFCLAWPIYAGDPQAGYVMALSLPFLCLCYPKARLSSAKVVTAIWVLAICAAGPQLLPVLDQASEMIRPSVNPLTWSLHPAKLLTTFFPLAYGSSPNPEKFWGWVFLNTLPWKQPFIFSIYAGLLPFVTGLPWIISSLAKRRRNNRRLLIFTFAFAIFVLLALGSYSPIPLYSWAAWALPFWNGFRFPVRLFFWANLLAIAAGIYGAEVALRLQGLKSKKMRSAAVSILLFGIVAVILALVIGSHEKSYWPMLRSFVSFGFLIFALQSTLSVQRKTMVLMVLCLVDLFSVSRHLVWAQPADLVNREKNPALQKILEHRANLPGKTNASGTRIASFHGISSQLKNLELKGLSHDVFVAWSGVRYNIGNYFGLETVQPHSSLFPNRPILSLLRSGIDEAMNAAALLGVEYLTIEQEGQVKARYSPLAQSYITFPTQVFMRSDAAEIVEMARLGRLNGNEIAAIEGKESRIEKFPPARLSLDSLEKKWDRIRFSLATGESDQTRYIVVNEAYHRQWRAFSRGKIPLNIVRANSWAMALELPPTHAGEILEISLEYVERSYGIGLALVGAWMLFLFTTLAQPLLRTRGKVA